MARKDHTSLHSHLQNLLSHLLKWAYEPNHRSISWHKTIDESRDRIEDLLRNRLASMRNFKTLSTSKGLCASCS